MELSNRLKSLGWIKWIAPKKSNNKLPTKLNELAEKNQMFKYPAKWYSDMVYYKGDPETTNEWIIVCTGGGYYEARTKYSVWASRAHNLTEGKLYLGCEFGPLERLIEMLDKYYFY